MKCSSTTPVDVPGLVYGPTMEQPEVAELEPDDGWRQWQLAQRLAVEPKVEFWETTVPMDLM